MFPIGQLAHYVRQTNRNDLLWLWRIVVRDANSDRLVRRMLVRVQPMPTEGRQIMDHVQNGHIVAQIQVLGMNLSRDFEIGTSRFFLGFSCVLNYHADGDTTLGP